MLMIKILSVHLNFVNLMLCFILIAIVLSCKNDVEFSKFETYQESIKNHSIIAEYNLLAGSIQENDSIKYELTEFFEKNKIFLQKMKEYHGDDSYEYSKDYFINTDWKHKLKDKYGLHYDLVKTNKDELTKYTKGMGNELKGIDYIPDEIIFLERENRYNFSVILKIKHFKE